VTLSKTDKPDAGPRLILDFDMQGGISRAGRDFDGKSATGLALALIDC
jgi:hypothetical protein